MNEQTVKKLMMALCCVSDKVIKEENATILEVVLAVKLYNKIVGDMTDYQVKDIVEKAAQIKIDEVVKRILSL